VHADGANILVLTFLHCRQIAVAGVVDEHIGITEHAFGLADGALDLFGIRRIQRKRDRRR
jgi:hypothetical protein